MINNKQFTLRVRLFYARAASGGIKELAQISFVIIIIFYISITPYLISKFKDSVERIQYYSDDKKESLKSSLSTSSTSEHPLPNITAKDGVWQPVHGATSEFYVFSAYVELRIAGLVRIIAAVSFNETDKVMCRLWLPGDFSYTVRARVQPIRQSAMYSDFGAAFVTCLPKPDLQEKRQIITRLNGGVVSVIDRDVMDEPPTNLLTIMNTNPYYKKNDINLHVCVQPLYNQNLKLKWFIEWIEFNRLLNVTHFYMYTQYKDGLMDAFIDHYSRKGLITIRSWNFPIRTNNDMLTAQLAAYNDCLYRSMAHARWLLIIDYDELVIPRQNKSLVELLREMTSVQKRKTSFVLQNVFFFMDWPDDSEYIYDKLKLTTESKTRRTVEPDNFYNYSRYFVYPRSVVELGTNFVTEILPFTKNFHSVAVPPRLALLHHYYTGCPDGKRCLDLPSKVDRVAHNWTSRLKRRISLVAQKYLKLSSDGKGYK